MQYFLFLLIEYYIEALQCFEHFYDLTNGRLWQMETTGRTLFSMACESLQNVYTTVAAQVYIHMYFTSCYLIYCIPIFGGLLKYSIVANMLCSRTSIV